MNTIYEKVKLIVQNQTFSKLHLYTNVAKSIISITKVIVPHLQGCKVFEQNS
jgi:hypothetical protein